MSFDTDVIKPGRGRAIRIDISLDEFATIAYRYSDVAGVLDGTNQYTPRLLNMAPVRRAFGQNRIAASSSTSLALNNADGAIDWICGRENIEDAAKARFRIYVTLYDPTASPLVFTPKMLGEFVLSSWPSRDNRVVSLSLADDFMGRLGAGLQLPTLEDWQEVGNDTNNPVFNELGISGALQPQTPIQLAFGEDRILAFPHIIPWGTNAIGEAYEGKVIVPLYCTTDLSAVSQDLVREVRVDRYSMENLSDSNVSGSLEIVSLPRTITQPDYAAPDVDAEIPVWAVEKSPTISKGGIDYQVVYLVVRDDLGSSILRGVYPNGDPATFAARQAWEQMLATHAYHAGYDPAAVDSASKSYACIASRVQRWYVLAAPASQITNPPGSEGYFSHAIDVLTDLASVYSSASVDAASAARVKAGTPNAACFGVVQPWTERANDLNVPPPPLSLRQVLTELAQSADLDVFINWAGEVAFSSDVWDFTTATQAGTLPEILETELNPGIRQWVPSNGERHAPCNRVYFEGGRANHAGNPGGGGEVPFQGPFDLPGAEIPTSVRALEVGLRQGWRPLRQQGLDPWLWRSIDGVCRDRVKFSMHIGGLRLELGAYFKLTWTRGPEIAGPYSSAVFQCESIAYAPYGGDTVEIEGVWRDDTISERQYLLDDEDLIVKSKGALTGNCFPLGTAEVDFDGTINLTTMGVVAGDMLVLRDTSQAATVFTRFGAWRITNSDPTALEVEVNGDGIYPANGSVPNAQWHIERGATTYHTAITDPTNYPSGGEMYGKVTETDGTTSDAEVGNRLISG